MSYSLYYSQYCYFCQKVLMHLRGREHPIELLNVADSAHQSALITGGGKGQVPCLYISQGAGSEQWMYESDDIIAYIKQHELAM